MKQLTLFLLILCSSFIFAQNNFKIVFLADSQYANNPIWINQIKTWGATGINLRIYRHILESSTHIFNTTEWNKVVACLTRIYNSGLDIYIRVNMFGCPPGYWTDYSTEDYQQSIDGVMYSPYYSANWPSLNLSSPIALSHRIAFFTEVLNRLSKLPTNIKNKIQLIVPTISQDDETELMLNMKRFTGDPNATWGWLSGYSEHDQNAFIQYLNNKYKNDVANLNNIWGSTFSGINRSNINIKNYDWQNLKDIYSFFPKGRKDFIDFLSGQLKSFIDTCASIVHNKNFKMGVQLGSVYDGHIEFGAFYEVAPLLEKVDVVFCDEIAEYRPNFNFAADYLRSVCNYWNWKRNKEGSTLGSLNFGPETNWPGYNHITPDSLVKNWQVTLQSYYDRGASILSISHWGTIDMVVPWYSNNSLTEPDIHFIIGDLIITNELTNNGPYIRSSEYIQWKNTLNNFKSLTVKTLPFSNSAIHLNPVMSLYSRTTGLEYTRHSHNLQDSVGYLPTWDGKNSDHKDIWEFPLYKFIKPRAPYSNNTYYNENCDFITDFMLEKSPEYFKEKYNTILLGGSSYFISDIAYNNLMTIDLKDKSMLLITGFTDTDGHREFAFTPGIRNEYDTYRSPIHLIWRTRSDLRQIWPDANIAVQGIGYDDKDFIWWAQRYGCGYYNESDREYPEWNIMQDYNGVPKFDYDKNLRAYWEIPAYTDIRQAFPNGHNHDINITYHPNIISFAKIDGYKEGGLLNNYINWPYIGTRYYPNPFNKSQTGFLVDKIYSFKLNQNFPNPFNPYTKIKYSIPQSSFVILKVYDILGREIVTLVKEEQLPGNYETIFNANNLSSGIYFYQLKTENYTQTKKMILMR